MNPRASFLVRRMGSPCLPDPPSRQSRTSFASGPDDPARDPCCSSRCSTASGSRRYDRREAGGTSEELRCFGCRRWSRRRRVGARSSSETTRPDGAPSGLPATGEAHRQRKLRDGRGRPQPSLTHPGRRALPAGRRRGHRARDDREPGALLPRGPRQQRPVRAGPRPRLTSSALTALVDRLERQGVAERVRHPRDRRRTIVHLTERGAAMVTGRATAGWRPPSSGSTRPTSSMVSASLARHRRATSRPAPRATTPTPGRTPPARCPPEFPARGVSCSGHVRFRTRDPEHPVQVVP